MILHDYLVQNGLNLDRKVESRLGELISDEYRETYSVSAPKIISDQFPTGLNDYPQTFLASRSGMIIKFLNPNHNG